VQLAFASEGSRLVVTGGVDQRLRVLDIASRQSWCDFAGHTGAVTSLKILPATDRLLSGSVDGTMRLWPSLKSNSVPPFPLRFWHNVSTRQPQAPVFSADGQYLAMLMHYNRAYRTAAVWSLAEDRQLPSVPGIPIAFVSGGEELLSWASRQIHRSKRASGEPVGADFSLVDKPASPEPQISEDGRRFFCLAASHVLTVHDVASRRLLYTCPEQTDWFRPTPDGSGAIVMGLTNAARYWDVEKNTLVLLASDQRYDAIAISADGRLAAIGGWQGDIRLYALPSGKRLTDLRSDLSGVVSLAFSRDGRTLASGSEDGFLRFVNLDSQRQTIALRLDGSIDWLRFSPANDALLAGTLSQRDATNGTYYLWHVPPKESALGSSAP
jgi:WD40 repeat protein